jgi:hypothetical protein
MEVDIFDILPDIHQGYEARGYIPMPGLDAPPSPISDLPGALRYAYRAGKRCGRMVRPPEAVRHYEYTLFDNPYVTNEALQKSWNRGFLVGREWADTGRSLRSQINFVWTEPAEKIVVSWQKEGF